jgi:hypothetical protein
MKEGLSVIRDDKSLTDTTASSCAVPKWTLYQYIWKKTTALILSVFLWALVVKISECNMIFWCS